MHILRFVHLLGITVWVGSLVFFTFLAAPSIFKNLPKETAGEVIGHIFPKYWIMGYVASVVTLGSLIALAYAQKSFPALRILLLVVMLGVTFYSGLVVGKNARNIKAEIKTAEETVNKEDLRSKFKRVHALSAILNLSVILLGLFLVYLTSKELQL
jgi:uncharacterized membrane protein